MGIVNSPAKILATWKLEHLFKYEKIEIILENVTIRQ